MAKSINFSINTATKIYKNTTPCDTKGILVGIAKAIVNILFALSVASI